MILGSVTVTCLTYGITIAIIKVTEQAIYYTILITFCINNFLLTVKIFHYLNIYKILHMELSDHFAFVIQVSYYLNNN